MKGFKEFLLRGNLIELAVAFIMGGVFAAVVSSFTQMFMDVLGKIGSVDTFSSFTPYGIQVGAFITALITFLITGFVVYVFVVTPYNKASNLRKKEEPAAAASTEDLLADIRDLLKAQADGTPRPRGTNDTAGGGTTGA